MCPEKKKNRILMNTRNVFHSQGTGYLVVNKAGITYLSLMDLSIQSDVLLGKLRHLKRARFLPRQGKELDQSDCIQ